MTETARIRWHDNSCGGSIGYIGRLEPFVFQVWKDKFGDAEWTLKSALPGQFDWRLEGDDPEALKKGAEAWLAEFASSLGASFPEAGQSSETTATTAGKD